MSHQTAPHLSSLVLLALLVWIVTDSSGLASELSRMSMNYPTGQTAMMLQTSS